MVLVYLDMNWPYFGRLTAVGIALIVVLTLTFGGTAAAHGGDDGAHHHDGWMGTHDGMGWGMGWGLWFLWPALVLAIAGVVAYLLLTQGGAGGSSGGGGSDDAVAVLRERYARGEIDDEEFEHRRRQLRNG